MEEREDTALRKRAGSSEGPETSTDCWSSGASVGRDVGFCRVCGESMI